MKKRNIFKPLSVIKAKNTTVSDTRHSRHEKWLFNVLPADAQAPNVEEEKPKARYFGLLAAVFLALFVLLSRSFYLQVIEGKKSLVLAQENRFREKTNPAPRGLFYDAKMVPLVKNVPNYEVTVIPNDLPKDEAERQKIYERLSATINISAPEIKKQTEGKGLKYTQPLLVAKSVSRDVSLVFESREQELRGFYVGINPIREYLDNGLLSHVFGYVGRISEEEYKKHPSYLLTDFIGKSGLEEYYENILRGEPGKERVEVDSKGQIIRTFGEKEPTPGDNMQLSIDFELQKKLTQALTTEMTKAKTPKGSAVAINPKNGEVLAFVSVPTYDNNLFAKGISDTDYQKLMSNEAGPLLDRALSGEYPSGSTIKPYVAAGGLEQGTITESSTVNSTGGIKVGEWEFPDWKAGGHGITNVVKALAESVNTFFYAVGGGYQNIKGLGPDLMKKYLEKFGFGKAVGVDINGEAEGSIPSPEWKERVKSEEWYLGDTYHMAIGQGDVLVTPLQMANALSTVANGGTMYRPHFLKTILDASGNIKSQKSPEIVEKNPVSPQNIDIVRRGMRACVTSGSCKALGSLPVSSAAKTGTAQYGPGNSKKHAWFTAFAPYEDPQIAIVVLLENGGEGSDTALPVAKETLGWYFTRR